MNLLKALIKSVPENRKGRIPASCTVLLVFAAGLMAMGCGSTSHTSRPAESESHYAGVAGLYSIHDQIESGFRSVRRIQNNAIYRSYFFPRGVEIREADLHGMILDDLELETSVDTHSNAGTATVIFNNNRHALLLSAAHTVNQPDTLFHFMEESEGVPEGLIEAVSIKVSENRFVITDNGIVSLEIVGADLSKDLALLITAATLGSRDRMQVLELPAGDFERIEWGSQIVALGYPRGIQMISSGVISLTSHPHRTLLADLNINRGFSGGIVSSVNTETGKLEWIGMLTSAIGEDLTYITPEKSARSDYTPDMVYRGDLYIENHRMIHYGIGYGVHIEDIKEFVRLQAPALEALEIPAGSIF